MRRLRLRRARYWILGQTWCWWRWGRRYGATQCRPERGRLRQPRWALAVLRFTRRARRPPHRFPKPMLAVARPRCTFRPTAIPGPSTGPSLPIVSLPGTSMPGWATRTTSRSRTTTALLSRTKTRWVTAHRTSLRWQMHSGCCSYEKRMVCTTGTELMWCQSSASPKRYTPGTRCCASTRVSCTSTRWGG